MIVRGEQEVTMKITINDSGRKRSATVKLGFLPPEDLHIVRDEKDDLLHAAGDAIISALTAMNYDDEDKDKDKDKDNQGEYND